MNVQSFFTSKVNETVTALGITHASAWNHVARIHPDAAILLRAAGQTRHAVQFSNSKIARPSAEARRKFAEDVQAEMKNTHCTYGVAFNRISSHKQQFINVQFPNSKDVAKAAPPAIGADGVPVLTPELKSIYRLPADTTPTEWAAASKANSLRTMSEVHFGKVFDALCELTQKEKSLNYENALRETKSRFSDLWAAVEALSMIPA